MRENKAKLEYKNGLIKWCLEHYGYLEDGKLPPDESGYADYGTPVNASHSNKAPYCKPKELKADIDTAIQRLKPTEKFVVVSLCIAHYDYQEVAFWLGKSWLEVQEIERFCIRKMRRCLNHEVQNSEVVKTD